VVQILWVLEKSPLWYFLSPAPTRAATREIATESNMSF
jgi:hypothetical protein